MGVSQPKLSAIEKQREGSNILNNIHHALKSELNVNPEWFESGKGATFLKGGPVNIGNYYEEKRQSYSLEPNDIGMVNEDVEGYERTESSGLLKTFDTKEEELSRKLIASYEKTMATQEENIKLLKEISALKDTIIERERQLHAIKSKENKGAHDPAGAR